MKYGFLTTLIPPCMEERVRAASTYNMQDAANALEWHIYEGLCQNYGQPIKIFNVLPVGSFPQYYRHAWVRRTVFSTDACVENVNVGFCNVKLLRKLHQPGRILRELERWCCADDEEKTLWVYTVEAPFVKAISRLKRRHPDLKVCAIVADLPDMSDLSSGKGLWKRLFLGRAAKSAYAGLSAFDGFVLLTRQMADYMQIKVPYCVMEGIATEPQAFAGGEPIGDGCRRILYSGTLHRRFGVLNLVDAFLQIPNERYRLQICGMGDGEAAIREAAARDPRIEFLGQMTRGEVLRLQRGADVLVNPRQNVEEFTKYSFPSKNLEYLSSGKPVVAYRLDGIPEEYGAYLNYVPDDSAQALRDVLIRVCEDADGSAAARALAAADFVREQKNAVAQARRIRELTDALSVGKR